MSSADVDLLLNLVGLKIKKKNTFFKDEIPANERFVVMKSVLGEWRSTYKFNVPIQNVKQATEIAGNDFRVLSAVFRAPGKPMLLHPPKATVVVLTYLTP
jgi:hypothetical protein